MRIGVDVGGTNTDAVLMDGRSIICAYKASTTYDLTSGILEAIEYLLDNIGIESSAIESVMIGTTHFTNALIERNGLLEVAVIRLASPSGHSVVPKVSWPEDLVSAIGDHTYLLPGGYEFDGREITPFDEEAVRRAAKDISQKGLKTVAISSVYASINQEMENRAATIVRQENPGIYITLSSDIGGVGLIERENATIMNASCTELACRVVKAFGEALKKIDIIAPVYFSQNDGTLISGELVERFPIFTFASGPTNSIRGAAFLSGVEDGIVMDIGGTTCDVGVLQKGFPRESCFDVDIGGVRTNFRMPDILAIGIGGGSRIHCPIENLASTERTAEVSAFLEDVQIGPDSVGHDLMIHGLVFGGDTLTTTDISVAANPTLAKELGIGESERVQHLSPIFVSGVRAKIRGICGDTVDRMKTEAGDVPVILVGGGHILLGHDLPGASQMIRPRYAEVANAVGAAIAQIGGVVDKIYSYQEQSRESALDQAKQEAIEAALQAGGTAGTARIVDVEEIPMAYVPGESVRIKVKAVAELKSNE